MRSRRQTVAVIASMLLLHACASTSSRATEVTPETVQGIASWYGQEFAGRATASGEIFDPLAMTAAHPSLPFGTIVEVTSRATGKSVEVRINDRGPYVGKRIIDLSYAAAEEIDLHTRGITAVEVRVISIGDGKRFRRPAVVMAKNSPVQAPVIDAVLPPDIAFPLPPGSEPVQATGSHPRNTDDFRVEVSEERSGVVVRKQVSADGTSLEIVGDPAGTLQTDGSGNFKTAPAPSSAPVARTVMSRKFVVQAGAFADRENAETLRLKLKALDPSAHIQTAEQMHRVRIGPFATREEAVAAQALLENAGLSGLVMPLDSAE